MDSWYERNKEHCLELAKTYREKNADKIKAYQAEYYKKRRAAMPPKEPKPPKPVEKTPAGFIKFSKNPPIEKYKPSKRKGGCRKPKPYYAFTPATEETQGWLMKPHQKDKLLKTCPQGFYDPPPSSDPFVLTFS